MNIGFIGAGKVGFSVGKFLKSHGKQVTGYYSRNPESSKEAAEFTGTKHYLSLDGLVKDSDAIFITVPDGEIESVWNEIKELPIQNKIISHMSGSLSSQIFKGIRGCNAFGYSIHPLFAINDKFNSFKELSQSFFTIEGDEEYLTELVNLFDELGNKAIAISSENKTKYHCVAVMVSNLYVGLVNAGETLLNECGFSMEEAHEALLPLIEGNTKNIVKCGVEGALTGPVERCDCTTVKNHMDVLEGDLLGIYRRLSGQIVEVAKRKNQSRDYDHMEELLK